MNRIKENYFIIFYSLFCFSKRVNRENEPARVTKNSSLNGLVSHLRWNAAFPSMVDSLEFSLRSLLADLILSREGAPMYIGAPHPTSPTMLKIMMSQLECCVKQFAVVRRGPFYKQHGSETSSMSIWS